MSFARPWLLLLFLVLPLVWWRASRRRPAALPSADLGALLRARDHGLALVPRLPGWLRALAIAAWTVAAAGPRWGAGQREEVREGINIALVVDVSSSMLAEDFEPQNRLDVARERVAAFIRQRRDDQIALVAFAADALTQVPLTLDHDALLLAVAGLHVGMLEDGTAIGTAIGTAANRLRRAAGRSKVMVLLTDGENNRGEVDPRTAALAAARFDIRIYTIGVGSQGEAPVPIGRGPSGLRYARLPVRLDETLLRDVAGATGGRYFRASDAQALGPIYDLIDRLEKTPLRALRYERHREAHVVPLSVGLVALLLEAMLAAGAALRVPV